MKYTVTYISAPTGYGWEQYHSKLSEFEDWLNEMRNENTASVRVWDETLQKFIFWKNAFSINPSIDMLSNIMRDMRTTTRKMKV